MALPLFYIWLTMFDPINCHFRRGGCLVQLGDGAGVDGAADLQHLDALLRRHLHRTLQEEATPTLRQTGPLWWQTGLFLPAAKPTGLLEADSSS